MASSNCCPTCGRTIKQIKKRIARPDDLQSLSTDDLYAYYAQVAPVEDTKFFILHCGDPELRDRALALLATLEQQGGKHSSLTKRDYRLLHQDWRQLPPVVSIKIEEVESLSEEWVL